MNPSANPQVTYHRNHDGRGFVERAAYSSPKKSGEASPQSEERMT